MSESNPLTRQEVEQLILTFWKMQEEKAHLVDLMEITAPDLDRLNKRVEARALSLHLRGEESGKHIRGEDLRCHASKLPGWLNARAVFGDDFS